MTATCELLNQIRDAKERSDAANADIRRLVREAREARGAGLTYPELGKALKMTPNGARLLLGRVERAEANGA